QFEQQGKMADLNEHTANVQVRQAVIGEASAIAEVLHRAFVEYEPLYTREAFLATTPSADQLRQRWDEGPVWVAVQDNRVVGTLSAVPRGEALYLRSMALLPSARGYGIGRVLLQQAEQFAAGQGFRLVFLCTTPFLTRAIRLYKKLGFRGRPEGPPDLFGTPLLSMEKSLSDK
ncbi:MAG: GNAT family N-acetyltransferase, partial [Syntrophomonadaceae bacterium]|nr:GNAT family N-acetyltransferase [Syntrophomonadaceae bacterium]